MKLTPYHKPYTKINLKWIKAQKTKTIKLLEENIGEKLLDFGLGNNFLAMTQKAQMTKAKIDKWDSSGKYQPIIQSISL